MAVKNIEININNGSTYDTLYPKTDYNNIINTPTIPSVPISIANGGTNGTTGSAGIYNLTNPCSTRSASQLNSYASSTYIPCYYGSAGYKFSLNSIMTYVNNNVSAGVKLKYGSVNGTGTSSGTLYTISVGATPKMFIISGEQTVLDGLLSLNTGNSTQGVTSPQSAAIIINMSSGNNYFDSFGKTGPNAGGSVDKYYWVQMNAYLSGTSIQMKVNKNPYASGFSTASDGFPMLNESGETYYWFAICE